ncbi:MAG: aldose 1-epimerase [Leptospirales bacterium]|jgi:aldose 1-epimerase
MSLAARSLRSPGGSDGIETVEFVAPDPDAASDRPAGRVVARIAVGVGNTLYYLGHPSIAGGRNLLHFPWKDLNEYRDNFELGGNPLLYPWANRLSDPGGFEFAGRRVDFPDPPPFWRDAGGLPLHGCLLKSDRWRTVGTGPETSGGAVHRAEQIFDRDHPAFACFPFAHRLRVEHFLENSPENSPGKNSRPGRERGARGALRLRIRTTVENTGDSDLPLSFGYHPYFSYAGFARAAVRIRLPATRCFETDDRLIPTGRLIPTEDLWPDRGDFPLASHAFDHGFTSLERGGRPASGARSGVPRRNPGPAACAEFQMTTPEHRITVAFGDAYPVAVIYAPFDADEAAQTAQEFVCFEPMLAPTNNLGFSTAAFGWPTPRSLAPGRDFTGTFWISAESV